MNLTFKAADVRGPLQGNVDRVAKAATQAMGETGEAAKRAVRADLAGAGFSAKWQNATRANLYPATGVSLSPAALIYNRISYSEIFETGGTIAGHPLLWLPIEANLPADGTKWTPRRYVQAFGPLVSVSVPGRRPLLFAHGRRGPPLFVGVSQVTLRRRLHADEAVAAEAARLPDRYDAALKSID